jgi:hypothetical protein
MKVGLLTIEQKEDIQYQLFAPDSYFNPVLDGNGDWIISTQEIDNCVNTDYLWVKELPLIDWVEPEEEQ